MTDKGSELKIPQTDPPRSPRDYLPTMYDLPSENPEEAGVPDEFHLLQPQLLRETFQPANYPADQIFVASDLNIYFDLRHTGWYKRPDWFAVVGVPRFYDEKDMRLSYVIWQEGVSPLIVVELLSPGTEKEDLGQGLRDANQPPGKWEVYERILRIPYYVVFDRYTDKMRAFQLVASSYNELALANSRLWMPEIELSLGLWHGEYQGVTRPWLRWQDKEGHWLPTPVEQERHQAERLTLQIDKERQRTEQERQRAERLAAKLREMGFDPDQID